MARLIFAAPDPKAGTRVKVLKDSRVPINGKPFLIKAGEVFQLGSKTNGEVTLVVIVQISSGRVFFEPTVSQLLGNSS